MGLPREGSGAAHPVAGDLARTDVPTCALDDQLGEVRERVEAAGWDTCVVVNEQRVVMGLLREKQLAGDPETRIEDAMRPGPPTFRPNVAVEEMAGFLSKHDLDSVPVTRSDGTLVGMLMRSDVESIVEGHTHE